MSIDFRSGAIRATLARLAERLVRLPLAIAAVIFAVLLTGLDGLAPVRDGLRFAVRLLLVAYLACGVANLPSFPRALRGPATARASHAWLLDMWSLISLLVLGAVMIGGGVAGLF